MYSVLIWRGQFQVIIPSIVNFTWLNERVQSVTLSARGSHSNKLYSDALFAQESYGALQSRKEVSAHL